jgi:hypothetical protein
MILPIHKVKFLFCKTFDDMFSNVAIRTSYTFEEVFMVKFEPMYTKAQRKTILYLDKLNSFTDPFNV